MLIFEKSIYLILYPSLENLTTHVSILEQDSISENHFKPSSVPIPIIVCTSPDTPPEASNTACHQALVLDTNAVLDQINTGNGKAGLEQAESPDVNKEVERAFENGSGHGEL